MTDHPTPAAEPKERPILFSAPMVRALLQGRKTQTRRAVKLPKALVALGGDLNAASTFRDPGFGDGEYLHVALNDGSVQRVRCPYADTLGDRLWVREAWAHDAETLEQCRAAHEDALSGLTYGPYYRATDVAPETLRWRPSIHMPRWASRITLEVTNVRVERLQDISEADAEAEGADPIKTKVPTARDAYRYLWDDINGAGGWDANPWVWVVSFRRIT